MRNLMTRDSRGYRHAAAAAVAAAIGLLAGSASAGPSDDAVTGPSAAGERLMQERAGTVPAAAPSPQLRQPVQPALVPSVMPSAGAPVAGADVQVNDPATDTPESTTQSETSMAVLGNTICAGYNDSGANRYSGYARSTDGGATWTDLGEIGNFGDPVIAVHDASGTFYYAEIATIGGNPAIGVAASTDDCQTFAAPVDASPGASAIATTSLNDKPWIAVDNTGGANDGNIYVCWTRFDPNLSSGSELRFSRSTDGGATYANEQILSPAGTAPFGCSVVVGLDGGVNVSWADRTGTTQNDIRFRRSTDGGITFLAAISASTGNRHPGSDTVVACGGSNRPTLTGNIRMLHQSWLAIDDTGGPYGGNLYLVWASDPTGTPDNSDVFFSRSLDNGATWSTPVQLGTEAGPQTTDQFEPFVAVGGTGTVSVAWYDRRNDAANNNLIDVYKTFSYDGGATFEPLSRVTDVNFPPPPIRPNFDPNIATCYMGEYIAVAADATSFYYMWGDNRNTVTTTAFPAGRPDPDIFFEAEPIAGAIPVCDANGDYLAECGLGTGLDGSASYDPDGGSLVFDWSGPFDGDPLLDGGATPTVVFTAPTGDKTVDLTVTDDEGSTAMCSASVAVRDTIPPDLTVPPDVTEECASPSGTAVALGDPVVSDYCDKAVLVQNDAPSLFPLGPTDVTWLAIDDDGNQTTGVQGVLIQDTTPPTVECNAQASITPPDAPISFTATAEDVCEGPLAPEITEYTCFTYTKKGKLIHKTSSCIVSFAGDTITIADSGGVDTRIEWTTQAADGSGNVSSVVCGVDVIKP
jgi:hypothetical protein